MDQGRSALQTLVTPHSGNVHGASEFTNLFCNVLRIHREFSITATGKGMALNFLAQQH